MKKQAWSSVLATAVVLGLSAGPQTYAAAKPSQVFGKGQISMGGYQANVSTVVGNDSGHATTYMPVWYLMQALRANGYVVTWNGQQLEVEAPPGVPVNTGSVKPGTGAAGVYLNGTLVQRVNSRVLVDPSSGKPTTYFPIWYLLTNLVTRVGYMGNWADHSLTLQPGESYPVIVSENQTFGTDTMQTVHRNLIVMGAHVIVKNVSVSGDLYVNPGRDGDVHLENVSVTGTIFVVSGGNGQSGIHLKNVSSSTVVLQSSTPATTNLEGSQTFQQITMASDSSLVVPEGANVGTLIVDNKVQHGSLDIGGFIGQIQNNSAAGAISVTSSSTGSVGAVTGTPIPGLPVNMPTSGGTGGGQTHPKSSNTGIKVASNSFGAKVTRLQTSRSFMNVDASMTPAELAQGVQSVDGSHQRYQVLGRDGHPANAQRPIVGGDMLVVTAEDGKTTVSYLVFSGPSGNVDLMLIPGNEDKVSELTNVYHGMTVIEGTTLQELESYVQAPDLSHQTFKLTSSDGSTTRQLTDPIQQGDQLTVTAENGHDQNTLTVGIKGTPYVQDTASDHGQVVKAVDVVKAGVNVDSIMRLANGTTASALLGAVQPAAGLFAQTYTITDSNGRPITDPNETLVSGLLYSHGVAGGNYVYYLNVEDASGHVLSTEWRVKSTDTGKVEVRSDNLINVASGMTVQDALSIIQSVDGSPQTYTFWDSAGNPLSGTDVLQAGDGLTVLSEFMQTRSLITESVPMVVTTTPSTCTAVVDSVTDTGQTGPEYLMNVNSDPSSAYIEVSSHSITVGEVKSVLQSADFSHQTLQFKHGNALLPDTATLQDSDTLVVIAEDGTSEQNYTIQVDTSSNTVVKDAFRDDYTLIQGVDHANDTITLRGPVTVQDVLSSITASDDSPQTYEVDRAGSKLSSTDVVHSGDVVVVTSEDGSSNETWTLSVPLPTP